MANTCSRYTMRGCPASLYLKCGAYAAGKNCWEVVKKPCCKMTDQIQCQSCSIYRAGHGVGTPITR